MKTIFIILALLHPALVSGTKDDASVRKLLARLATDDGNAFSSEYFRHTFNKWNKRVNIRSFRLDSVIDGFPETELQLSNDRMGLKVALAVSGEEPMRVFEARRLLIPDRTSFGSRDQLVLDFVEQFAWLYDSGDDSILLDFLYPKHIRLSYQNETKNETILETLRQRFPEFMEISNISWAGRGAIFEIKLTMDSPLQPLVVELDLVKYSTARFFEHEDRDGRIAAFADSIRGWIRLGEKQNERIKYFVSSSNSGSVSRYLHEQMSTTDYDVLEQDDNGTLIEITLPEMEGLPSHILRMMLRSRSLSSGKYTVEAEPQNSVGRPTDQDEIRMQYRYLVLNAPGSIDKNDAGQMMAGKIIIHANENEFIDIGSRSDYDFVLRKVSEDKYTYFVPHRSARRSDGAKSISGYVVWKDKSRLWHHIAKVEEVLIRGKLSSAQIDIYPFIRSDNVLNLLAEPDETTKLQNIGIKIR